jgi:hypothetical protein
MLYQDLLLHNNLQAGVRTLAAAKVVQIITVRKRELKIKKNELSSSLLFFSMFFSASIFSSIFLSVLVAAMGRASVPCSLFCLGYWEGNLVSW